MSSDLQQRMILYVIYKILANVGSDPNISIMFPRPMWLYDDEGREDDLTNLYFIKVCPVIIDHTTIMYDGDDNC